MDVQAFYDTFDESARLGGQDNRHLIELYRKRFLYSTLIDKYKPKKIVQIACGTGVHTHWLCENYQNVKIYASDILAKHVEQLKDFPNLDKRLWNCVTIVPEEYYDADIVLVEGAWYHLNWTERTMLLKNLRAINPKVVVIDWLSAWHDTTQRLMQDKIMPANYRDPRPDEPFVFDTVDDLQKLKAFGTVELFPVDMDLRFGYTYLNQVSKDEFLKYIEEMNKVITFYDSNQTFIMNATEHGCYILTVR